MRLHWSIPALLVVLAGCAGGGGTTHNAIPSIPTTDSGGASSASTLPQHFTVVDLGAGVQPKHVNDNGLVVGTTASGDAFAWNGGALTSLHPQSGYATATASWVNDSGTIVGTSYGDLSNNFHDRATMWTTSGAVTDLGSPGNAPYSFANAVNNNGLIVGGSVATDGMPFPVGSMVTVFDGHGGASGFPSTGSPLGGVAYGINDSGEIAGGIAENAAPDANTLAFTALPFTTLTMPANAGDGATAVAVNSSGNVAGYYSAGPYNRMNSTCCGFYLHGGTMTEIDDPSGHNYLAANAMNDNNWIVGQYGTFSVPQARAFLYNGNTTGPVVDLNGLLPANCGWVLNAATSVNASGQIVGTGTLNGTSHGFLLTPVN